MSIFVSLNAIVSPSLLLHGRDISPTFKWPVNADSVLKNSYLVEQIEKGKKKK